MFNNAEKTMSCEKEMSYFEKQLVQNLLNEWPSWL